MPIVHRHEAVAALQQAFPAVEVWVEGDVVHVECEDEDAVAVLRRMKDLGLIIDKIDHYVDAEEWEEVAPVRALLTEGTD